LEKNKGLSGFGAKKVVIVGGCCGPIKVIGWKTKEII